MQKVISTGPAPDVVIDAVTGDLQLKGWERPEVMVKASYSENIDIQALEDGVHIQCRDDCLIRVPEDGRVRIGSVNGNARIKMLESGLSIELVSGSLEIRDVGGARAGKVHGDLLARHIDGDLRVEQVNGNAIVRDVQGACVLPQVGGNLKLRDAEDSVDSFAGGNVKVQLSLLAGDHYTLQAGGNIHCTVPEDASLQLNLHSGARIIQIRLPDGTKQHYPGDCSMSLGSGGSLFQVNAGGTILLNSEEMDLAENDDLQNEFDDAFAGFAEEFGEHFSEQIESQMDAQMKILDEQMENLSEKLGKAGLAGAEAERILESARMAGDRANARVQEKIRRAQEKMDRKLAAAHRKAELRSQAAERRSQSQRRRSWNFEWAVPAPVAPKPAASDEERLMILRMLEQKKITLEQAESLLAALDNG